MRRSTYSALVALAGCMVAAFPAAAGPINPPPGPVVGTGKTLTDVEPRIAIRQPAAPASADAMVVISQPGSYYLASDIDAGTRSGIQIAASDVRLDLNGFTIRGDGFTEGRAGVATVGDRQGVAVRNGSIALFRNAAVNLGASYVDNAVVENVQIRQCAFGIRNPFGYAGVYRGNTISVVGSGIAASFAIQAGFSCLVQGNQIMYSGATGTDTAITTDACSRVVGNTVMSALGVGIAGAIGCEISGNTVTDAGNSGITAGAGSRITGNTVYGAGRVAADGAGVRAGGAVIEDNFVAACDIGLSSSGGCSIVRNRFHLNTTNLQTTPTDVVGPTVTAATAFTATNPLANIHQ